MKTRAYSIGLALFLSVLSFSLFSQDVEEYKAAYDSYQAKDYSAAEKSIDAAIAKEPENRKYIYLRALILAKQKKDTEAIQALVKCKTLKPDDYSVLFMLGSMYMKRKEYLQATESFEQGLAYKPGDYSAGYQLATAYVKLRKYKKAADVLSKMKDAGEKAFDYNYLYGLVLRSLGQHAEAIKFLSRAHELDPKDTRAQLKLADSYQREGKYREAMNIITLVLAEQPGNADALYTLGSSQLGSHEYEAAISTATKMTVVSANDYRGYLLRGKAYQGLNKPDKAVPDLKKVFDLDNGGACTAANLLASIYYESRQFMVAEGYYKRVYDCRHSFQPLLMLAHCYYKQDRFEKALETYKKVLSIEPDNDDATKGMKSSQEQIDRKNKVKKPS
ncbi:MAG: tetratricopeptide repeat protein [Candidatus Coatesbacteria bacterium]|nr:tetratricopeptide repeat protein [Candidatus Coatesbacteria bacterium]